MLLLQIHIKSLSFKLLDVFYNSRSRLQNNYTRQTKFVYQGSMFYSILQVAQINAKINKA